MYSRLICALVCVIAVACSSGGGAPTSPTPPQTATPPPQAPPAGAPTITITATGVVPRDLTVAVGTRVLFVNADARAHELWGGPDHDHRDCAEVDVAGFLVPGQSRESGTFTVARTCEFHDHTNVGNPAFQGRIVVQ